MPELWRLPAGALAGLVRRRQVSAEEVCLAFLHRAAAVDHGVNCFVGLDGDAALVAARAVDRAVAGGGTRDARALGGAGPPLAGVPYAAKDIFVRDGRGPGAGAAHVGVRLRAPSAAALDRVESAGAVCLGRLNLDPWAYAATGANPHLGDVRNPWNVAHVAGGSSSGAAAAVATRAVPFALAGDTGGSIRIPAALCGVTGLKPTFGRVSRRGALPLSYAQDVVGALAASASDLALLLGRLAGYDPLDPASIDAPVPAVLDAPGQTEPGAGFPSEIRVGVDRGWFEQRCEPPVVALAEEFLGRLAQRGARIVEVDLGALPGYDLAAAVLTQAESASLHRVDVRERPADYPPTIRTRLHAGLACQGSDHVDALRYQGYALRELLEGPLAAADVLAAPVTGRTAPSWSELDGLQPAGAVALSVEMLSLNRPFSLVGVPALSLPIGFADGLPVGLQLVGRPWSEGRLLTLAAAYQADTDWHLRVPDPPPTDRRGEHRDEATPVTP